MIKYVTKKIDSKEAESITCDICGKTYCYNEENIWETQEFCFIRHNCGYGSVFGDGSVMAMDVCQHCLKEKFGEHMRVEESIWPTPEEEE